MAEPIEQRLLSAIGGRRGVAAADRLCEACAQLLSVDGAAISLVFDGANVGTLGASDARARMFDELQFTMGEGPCLDSVAARGVVMVADLADPDELRWPGYGPVMLAHQVRTVYAMPVVVAGEYVGALDLFRADPAVLDAEQMATLVMAAELAQMPVLDLLAADFEAAVADPGSDAWKELNTLSRAEVSQATGMVMAQLGIEAAAALARLRAHAYATARSATEVARDILDRTLYLEAD
ncbi:MAG TPA: GAF domain-containing protein [Mycobacterium sp.]|nr:GAF domain-containing protein [Mycobacterium sp.]